jgi:hypothetical protein
MPAMRGRFPAHAPARRASRGAINPAAHVAVKIRFPDRKRRRQQSREC